jgi:CRISPR-associated protein Csm4
MKTDMTPYRIRIQPLSAFGTRPLGDTLFGQLCWAVRNRHGEERLDTLLDGYTQGQPFAVVSDAFPAGTCHVQPCRGIGSRWRMVATAKH